ncbi:MAG: hypothetical protein GEV10_29545 [Streptosporangiales bacterium]|nr:hypothetical protein [Streptosporangiales bacterium]
MPLPRFAWRPLVALAAVFAAVLTVLSPRYGFHRDELYFLVAGKHLAAGYVDQPPLTPLLARVSTAVFGESPAGLRVVATLTGVAVVLLVALVARELGGGRGAQVAAALCTAVSVFFVATAHMVSTATFDVLAWVAAGWLVLRVLRTGNGRWWLAVGAVAGVSLLNKYLVVLLFGCLAVALLAVGPRQVLRTWWLPAGIVLALLIAAPNLVWQATHGWPQLTVAAGISSDDGTENRLFFLPGQILYISPGFVPIWIAGIVRLLRDPALRWARSMALTYPVLAVAVLVTGGKAYYLLPILLILLAAGVPPVLTWLGRGRLVLRRALAGFVLVTAALATATGSLPVLPAAALDDAGILAMNPESGEQVGWDALARTVGTAWREIPADRRAGAVVFTQNYGQAGAIAHYGPALGLPQPYSGHMSFHDWGPPPDTARGPVLLVVQAGDGGRSTDPFTDCRTVARNDNGLGLDNEEQGALVLRCDGPHEPWSRLWPDLRRYY